MTCEHIPHTERERVVCAKCGAVMEWSDRVPQLEQERDALRRQLDEARKRAEKNLADQLVAEQERDSALKREAEALAMVTMRGEALEEYKLRHNWEIFKQANGREPIMGSNEIIPEVCECKGCRALSSPTPATEWLARRDAERCAKCKEKK